MERAPEAPALRVAVLGPVRAWVNDTEIPLGPARQRAVLAILATEAGRTVSREALIDGVWGDAAPASAASGIHIYVAGLRRVLEPGRARRAPGKILVTGETGYTLRMPPGNLDAMRLAEQVATAARLRAAGDLPGALARLDAARPLWHGRPFAGLPGPFAETERGRLEALRQQADEDRSELRLELGEHEAVVTDLTALARAHPLRERPRALLMLALYRCGRPAEALGEFRALRERLVADLGIEPGPALQTLHRRILAADPVIDAPTARQAPPHGPAVSAPAPARSPAPAQLPSGTAHFTARATELRRLHALLPAPGRTAGNPLPIAAVSGPAGSGKTALAVHFAHQVTSRFPDGQFYVNLHGFGPESPRAPEQVLGQMLRALGVTRLPTDLDELSALFRSHLAGRRILLVLDNAVGSGQVVPLLPGNGNCLVLTTSRNDLTGLVTGHGAERITLDALRPEESVTLLRTILGEQRVAQDFTAADDLARLCAHLPLALRLAADRLAVSPHLSLTTLARGLTAESERLDAFTLPAAEDTVELRVVFSWSYQALGPRTARVFRLLGLHPGPELSEAAAAALAGITTAEVRPHLRTLTSVHLLQETGADRYRVHDLLRLYARERAHEEETEAGRVAAVRRILCWYLHTAEGAARVLSPYRNRPRIGRPEDDLLPHRVNTRSEALAWYETEYTNLMRAVDQAAATGEHVVAWQLPIILWDYFLLRRPWAHDWISTHETGLDSAVRLADPRAFAWTLSSLGYTYQTLRRFEEGLGLLTRAQEVWRSIGDEEGQALGLIGLGLCYRGLQRFAEANECCDEAVGLWRSVGDDFGLAFAYSHLGAGYHGLRQYDRAIDNLRLALTTFRTVSDLWGESVALTDLGRAFLALERHDEALDHLNRALRVQTRNHDRLGEARTLSLLGRALLASSRTHEAADALHRAVLLFDDLGDPQAIRVRALLARLTADSGTTPS